MTAKCDVTVVIDNEELRKMVDEERMNVSETIHALERRIARLERKYEDHHHTFSIHRERHGTSTARYTGAIPYDGGDPPWMEKSGKVPRVDRVAAALRDISEGSSIGWQGKAQHILDILRDELLPEDR